MRLSLDPMPALRERAEGAVNLHYDLIASRQAQRDAEHAAKREAARHVLRGEDAPAWFATAAEIEGMTAFDLAQAIDAKPDDVAERGLARRRVIMAVRQASTAAAIDSMLADAGIENQSTHQD